MSFFARLLLAFILAVTPLAAPAQMLLTKVGPGGFGVAVAPTVPLVFSAGGDSWTKGNEQEISRAYPTVTNTDRWTNQLATLFGTTEYTTAGQTGVTNGIINVGYGGQTSQVIYTNIDAIITANSARMTDTWSFWGGRNNVGSDAQIANITTAQGQFLTRITHERKMLFLPSMGGSLSGTIDDWARQRRVQFYDWRNYRKYTFNHWRYWGGVSPNGAYPNSGTLETKGTLTSGAELTGTVIAGTAMTVGAVSTGAIAINQFCYGTGVSAGTQIVSGAGLSWTITPSQTVASTNVHCSIDASNVSAQKLISTLALSANTITQDHPNYVAAPYMAGMFQPLIKALWNQDVYLLEQTIPDVAYDMAAGATLDVYAKGYVTGCALTTDDPTYTGLFTVSLKSGTNDTCLLTRTSASAGNIPGILNYRITVTGVDTAGATHTSINDVRLLNSAVGAASTVAVGATFPRDTYDQTITRRWPRMQPSVTPWTNDAKFTVVFAMKQLEDATGYNFISTSGNNILINRVAGAGNKLAIQFKDSGGTQRLNWTTVTTNFNVAGGETWVLLSIDLTAGVPKANAWSVRAGSAVDIANGLVQPVTGTGLLNLAGATPVLFAASSADFNGSVKTFWAAQGVYFDFSVQANRDIFVNGTTGAAVDLGSDGSTGTGVTPQVYFRGAPGDWVAGKNFGSGVDWTFNDQWLLGTSTSDPTVY